MRDKDFLMLQEAYINVLISESTQSEMDHARELLVQKATKEGKSPNLYVGMVDEIKNFLSRGAKFASFFYVSQTTGSKMKYLVNLGTDYEAVKDQSKVAIDRFVQDLPEDDPRRLAAQKAFTRVPKYCFRVNLGNGIAVGTSWPDLKKYPEFAQQAGIDPKHMVNLSSKPTRERFFAKYPNFDINEFVDSHPQLVKIYISGNVKSVSDIVQNRQTPISQGEVSQLHRDAGTRQSTFKSFIIDPKNVAGVKISGGTIMFQDPQAGEPYIETQDEEDAPEKPEQETDTVV